MRFVRTCRAGHIGDIDSATSVPELAAAEKALSDGENLARLRSELEQREANPADKMTIQVDGKFPVESDAWHDWWRSFRRDLGAGKPRRAKASTGSMLCFLTAKLVEPAATPVIRP